MKRSAAREAGGGAACSRPELRSRNSPEIARPRARAGEAAAFRASHSEWASISTYLAMLPPESGREAGSGGGEGG